MTVPFRTARLVLLACLCAAPLTIARAQSAAAAPRTAGKDTTLQRAAPPFFTRRQGVMLGLALAGTVALAPLDRGIRRSFQGDESQQNGVLRQAATAFSFVGGPGPFIAGGGLFVAGEALGQRSAADLGVHLTEGVLLAAGLDGLLKGFTGRTLPNASGGDPDNFSFGRGFHEGNGPYVSFPSGHTAAAFAAAAVLTQESARWRPGLEHATAPIAYAGATLVALSRLYEDVHWASDLPLGAAIGVWSGTTVVAQAHSGSLHGLKRWLLGTTLLPDEHGVVVAWSSTGGALATR